MCAEPPPLLTLKIYVCLATWFGAKTLFSTEMMFRDLPRTRLKAHWAAVSFFVIHMEHNVINSCCENHRTPPTHFRTHLQVPPLRSVIFHSPAGVFRTFTSRLRAVLTALFLPDDTSITRCSLAEQQSTSHNHTTLSLLYVYSELIGLLFIETLLVLHRILSFFPCSLILE